LLLVALDFLDPRRWSDPSDQHVLNIISRDIELLLAQPEQEPAAWIIETEIHGKLSEWVCTDKKHYMEEHDSIKEPIPLYTAPQKRKHLTDIEISKGFKADDEATHLYSYWAGVEFAEKHHGIGGGCDE
jgi:hypothetical protein